MAFPEDRPDGYDADKYWDVQNDVWISTYTAGQGSYVEYVVAISEEGEIYFRAVT